MSQLKYYNTLTSTWDPIIVGATGPTGPAGSGRGSGGGNLLAGPVESDCAGGTTLTSPVVETLYGPVQIQATVASGVICDVTTLVEPSGDGRTNDISREVFPYLDEQAVKVGVNFQAVSGATYTSEGYRSALQSILDQT